MSGIRWRSVGDCECLSRQRSLLPCIALRYRVEELLYKTEGFCEISLELDMKGIRRSESCRDIRL